MPHPPTPAAPSAAVRVDGGGGGSWWAPSKGCGKKKRQLVRRYHAPSPLRALFLKTYRRFVREVVGPLLQQVRRASCVVRRPRWQPRPPRAATGES